MSLDSVARKIANMSKQDRDQRSYTSAKVTRVDERGTVYATAGGSEFPLQQGVAASVGQSIDVRFENGKAIAQGNYSDPPDNALARLAVKQLEAERGRIDDLESKSITADSAIIKDLQSDTAKVHNLTAEQLSAAAAYIASLTAGSVTAQEIIAINGDFATVKANAAKVANLTAEQLEADHAKVGKLDTDYAQINLANVNNAYIKNGAFDKAAVFDATVFDLTGDKATLKEINAANINVVNLNAKNLTVETADGYVTIGNKKTPTKEYLDSLKDELQQEIDGAIETFTVDHVPTLENAPASAWTDDKEKAKHVGDVAYVVNDQIAQNGYCYRFALNGTTFSWQLIKDSDVTAALSRLQTAEGKIGTIERFDEQIATFKTETEGSISTLQTKTTTLETSLGDKVSTTTFNELEDTVEGHTSTLTTVQSTLQSKADSSTVQTLRSEYNQTKTTVAGHETRLTATESVANGVRADFDNLEIGGRNLLKGRASNSSGSSNGLSYTYNASTHEVHITGTNTKTDAAWTIFSYSYLLTTELEPGEFYTLTAYGNLFDAAIYAQLNTYIDTGSQVGDWSVGLRSNRMTHTAKCRDTYVSHNLYGLMFIGVNPSVRDVDITVKFKFEKSTKPSDWTPAPEDLETEVTTLKQDYATYKQTTTENLSTLGTTVQGINGRVSTAESTIAQHSTDIEAKVSKDGVIAAINLSTEESGGSAVKINADKVNITGAAVFSAINNDTGTTKINGGKVDADTLHVKAANIDGSLTIGKVDGLQGALDGKASTTAVANAAKRTYVSIVTTALNYEAGTATLEATLYVDGAATTSNVTYEWLRDGSAVSGATNRTLNVIAALGLEHAYSCKATYGEIPAETGTIDLKAQVAAAKTASNYIAADATGIKIANANPSTATTYQHQTATETEFVNQGVSTAAFGGSKARIGEEDAQHVEILPERVDFLDADGESFARVSDTMRIGYDDSLMTILGANEFKLVDAAGSLVTRVRSSNTYDRCARITIYVTSLGRTVIYSDFNINPDMGVTAEYEDGTALDPPEITGAKEFTFATAPTAAFHLIYYTPDPVFDTTFGTRRGTYGIGSFAAGVDNQATRQYSTAIGRSNAATAMDAYAFGRSNVASARDSYAIGRGLKASSEGQTVVGKYNEEDTSGKYAFIIGAGDSDSSRFNAAMIGYDGEFIMGQIERLRSNVDKDAKDVPSANWGITNRWDYDKQGNRVGYMEVQRSTNGVYRSFAVENPKSGAADRTVLYLNANDDGTRSVSLTSGVAWPIANGGTGATSAANARKNLGAVGATKSGNDWALLAPDGDDDAWFLTTTKGICPRAGGGSGSLGTASWPFNNLYAKNIYHDGTKLGSFATKSSLTVIAVEDTSFSGTVSVPANSGTSVTITMTVPSGYTFGSLESINTNHQIAVAMTAFARSGTKYTVYLRNLGSSAMSTTVTITVRFLKVSAS